jgi:hypothetical protein
MIYVSVSQKKSDSSQSGQLKLPKFLSRVSPSFLALVGLKMSLDIYADISDSLSEGDQLTSELVLPTISNPFFSYYLGYQPTCMPEQTTIVLRQPVSI